ncbi:MAG: adenylate/guanylate cyclase domain-containing protein [Candidatus Rokuibacteriota bacterium]
MLPGRHYREVTCALCAVAAMAVAVWVGGPTAVDGPLLDLAVTTRSLALPAPDTPNREPVAVIAVDARSLDAPEFAPYPRTFLAPVWAVIVDGVLQAGARAVGFDFIFAYSANRFSPDFDAPFLAVLARHRERVVLGRSANNLPAHDTSALRLGGERREVTVMFADLSGFTALSGKVEPEALTRLTNQYLSLIVGPVEATGGYVDKFIGDAVLAIWGAPVDDHGHGAKGVRAALEAVARIRQAREAAEAKGELGFSVKIGINSGPAVVGNVGTDKRFNYTAVGETVNVASRLESVPGIYACQIVVGPRTAELARDEFLLRELDLIQVKGRDTPLPIFEPLVEHARATPSGRDRAARYAEALAHYRARRFADACAVWDALAREEQNSSPAENVKGEPPPIPASRMAARARAFAANPPPEPWDGVWVLTSK